MMKGPYDFRKADELVASTRLNVIEKEHKSFASSIDIRELFALDETPKPEKKKGANDTFSSRASLGSVVTDSGLTTPRKLPDASAQKVANRSYADEEMIWRNKTSAPNYFQKRTYEEPILQAFFANLTMEQRKRYKELTRSLLHSIADKHRAVVSKIKEEMDKEGIFHPTANAHRVHCIYLLKMHKSITACNIEDPVLRQLQAELDEKDKAYAAEDEKRRLLFRIAAVGREEAAREIAERKAAILANFSQKEARTPSVASSITRKASMMSLGVQSSSASGAPRKQSSATLTLDQILLNSSTHTAAVPLEVTRRGCQGLNLSRRQITKIRKTHRIEVAKKVERSSGLKSSNGVKKHNESPVNSEATVMQSFFGVAIKNNSSVQVVKSDQKHDVMTGSVEMLTALCSVSETAKDSHAGKGRRVIESDESESESIADSCTGDSYVHSALFDPILGPQPTATATGTEAGTLDFAGSYENRRLNMEGVSRIEKDNQLKTALRGGRHGRRLKRISAAHLLLPKAQRILNPLGLSAVLLKPINPTHTTIVQNSAVQLNGSISATVLPDSIWNASGHRPVAHYMTGTRNMAEKDRLMSGFVNYFQGEEVATVGGVLANKAMQSIKPITCRFTTQDLSISPVDDRKIDLRAVECDLSVEVAVADSESPPKSGQLCSAVSRRHLRERVEESDGSMSQGRGSRVLSIHGTDAEVQSSAMQRKLVQMWDCLQISSSSRLDYTQKYAVPPFSSKLGLSIDLWSEVAVLVMTRQEITRMLQSVKRGSRSMPIQAHDLIEAICSAVPADLASRSSMYLPLDLPSLSIKTKDRGKDTESESGVTRKSGTEQLVPLSATMLTKMIEQITQRFRVASASESIMHYKMQGPNESRNVRRAHRSVRTNAHNTPDEHFARDLASTLKLSASKADSELVPVSPIRRDSSNWKMRRSTSQLISEVDYKDDVGLIIRSGTEASLCLLKLLKITDQLLLSSARRTMDEVGDTVTFGKMTVQEWMTSALPEISLVAVTISVPSS